MPLRCQSFKFESQAQALRFLRGRVSNPKLPHVFAQGNLLRALHEALWGQSCKVPAASKLKAFRMLWPASVFSSASLLGCVAGCPCRPCLLAEVAFDGAAMAGMADLAAGFARGGMLMSLYGNGIRQARSPSATGNGPPGYLRILANTERVEARLGTHWGRKAALHSEAQALNILNSELLGQILSACQNVPKNQQSGAQGQSGRREGDRERQNERERERGEQRERGREMEREREREREREKDGEREGERERVRESENQRITERERERGRERERQRGKEKVERMRGKGCVGNRTLHGQGTP